MVARFYQNKHFMAIAGHKVRFSVQHLVSSPWHICLWLKMFGALWLQLLMPPKSRKH